MGRNSKLEIFVDSISFMYQCPKCGRRNTLSGFPNPDGVLIWNVNGFPVTNQFLTCQTTRPKDGCGHTVKMKQHPQISTSQAISIEEL